MTRLSYKVWFGLAAVVAAAAYAALALVGTDAPNAASKAVPAASCSPKPYAYAGLVSNVPAKGIAAVVTTIAAATVPSGRVAGWIGIGSPKAGPGGQAEWLQTGVNTQAGIGSALYAEITQPGRPTRYLTLASAVIPGSSYRLAVVELPGKPDTWHVLVNGKVATGPINLPGSSAFRPMAMGESGKGDSPKCNGYGYRFDQLRIMTNGSWKALTAGSVLSDLGYKVTDRTKAGFTAVSG